MENALHKRSRLILRPLTQWTKNITENIILNSYLLKSAMRIGVALGGANFVTKTRG
jgi:hypothetical protein